jgi:hypothetical protein
MLLFYGVQFVVCSDGDERFNSRQVEFLVCTWRDDCRACSWEKIKLIFEAAAIVVSVEKGVFVEAMLTVEN